MEPVSKAKPNYPNVGPEVHKAHVRRLQESFYDIYLSGHGLDIGYKGANNALPVTTNALGIDKGYPGYNGVTLPFQDESQDFVFASHVLEHIPVRDTLAILKEWYRVLKVGGYMIINVPSKDKYEKKEVPPSWYNADHKKFYRPSDLLIEIECAFHPNSYELVMCRELCEGWNPALLPTTHSTGEYSIEVIIEKVTPPTWTLGQVGT